MGAGIRLVLGAALAAGLLAGQAAASVPGDPVGADDAAIVASPQRAAILDALRPAVESELGLAVEFVISCIRVSDGWAFVNAEPQRKGGGKIDPRVLDDWDYRDGVTATAVLRFRSGQWHLVRHALGATDAWYVDQGPASLWTARCH